MKGLPKDALVEKQVLYHMGRRYSDIDEDEDEEGEGDTALSSCSPIYSTGTNQIESAAPPFRLFVQKQKVLLI